MRVTAVIWLKDEPQVPGNRLRSRVAHVRGAYAVVAESQRRDHGVGGSS